MHIVNDINLRRSVSKLKIKLQTKLKSHEQQMAIKAKKKAYNLQAQNHRNSKLQNLNEDASANEISQQLVDGVANKSYRLTSVS